MGLGFEVETGIDFNIDYVDTIQATLELRPGNRTRSADWLVRVGVGIKQSRKADRLTGLFLQRRLL